MPTTTAAPDGCACWSGDWRPVTPLTEVWTQSAVVRTVRALPQLHPWRLGDAKGSTRLLQWVGGSDVYPDALAVLTVTARDPGLEAGDDDLPHDLTLTGLGAGQGPGPALLLDTVPSECAVTLAGDAVHLWWPYRGTAPSDVGRAARAVRAATQLADAFPHFVLAQFPDRSTEVEDELAERTAAAREYRARRRPGTSVDPVMRRIYDQARATLPRT
ncbi:MAG: hypothetical protein ABIV05_02985 [Actinomycetota bacterium]